MDRLHSSDMQVRVVHENGQIKQAVNAHNIISPSGATGKLPPISGVILFHAEYPTLIHTLDSWEKKGMLSVVSEFLFFLNGINSRQEFDEKVPQLQKPEWKGKVRVITSPENLPLGLAIRQMVHLAAHDLVLLLEKDWALIEPESEVRSQLMMSVSLLQSGEASLVRFRHRHRPGAPLHARIMHQGREPQMLRQQSNLYCYMHHWIKDLEDKYSDYFAKCKGNYTLSEPVWCSKARYCQWTNNPCLFNKRWFMDNLGNPFLKDYTETKKKDPSSAHLDFEFYTNWNEHIWNGREYVVALPLGLFEHQEVGEQNLQNTLWYGWNRLNTDTEEKMAAYFEIERKECSNAAKTHTSGVTYPSKFPLDFVHLYHYNRAMKRRPEEAVDELAEKVKEMVLELEKETGNWRVGITELTNTYYEKILFAYPTEPASMRITFVTSVYRPEHIGGAAANMNRLKHYILIVYTDDERSRVLQEKLRDAFGWTESDFTNVRFVSEPADVMIKRVLGIYVDNLVDKITTGDDWRNRVSTRGETSKENVPSAMEIKLRLAKPVLLRDVERSKEGLLRSTTHIVWFDAISPCIQKSERVLESDDVMQRQDHVFRGHMVLNCMVSGKFVKLVEDVEAMMGRQSGFDVKALMTETETRDVSQGLRFVDGRTIGGSRLAITLMAGYYDVVLRDMLKKGQLGTEREPLTIAQRNVEYNFRFVDAWSLCPQGASCGAEDAVTKDSSAIESSAGCRVFEWASRCSPMR